MDKMAGTSYCCSQLVIEGYSQTHFVNYVPGIFSSAGLLIALCSKTAKYIVRGHGGILGSEYVSYYTVVAC